MSDPPSERESRVDVVGIGPEDVLETWLGVRGSPPLAKSATWYKKDTAFDANLRDTFGEIHERAARGALDSWKQTPRGRLALVILLDQFSRNMHRGTPRAFAQDARASTDALEAIARGVEDSLTTVERSFLYMPLMHAEDATRQHEAIAAFERLVASAPADLKDYAANSLDYARRHAAIVDRFGRFPHRNTILGRASTAEEIEFLKQPGSSF